MWYYYDNVASPEDHRVDKGNKGWIGALQREESFTTSVPGYQSPKTQTVHYYDSRGRSNVDLSSIDGKWFYSYTEYDDTYNRVSKVHHYWRPAEHESPADQPYAWHDFGYQYAYSSNGYLQKVTDSAQRTWWEAHADHGYDHLGRPVLVRKGNGHWTQRSYRETDGVLTEILTGAASGTSVQPQVQNLTFTWDGLGNLTQRSDLLKGLSESYEYDSLNRLTHQAGSQVVKYLANGNVDWKKNVAGLQSDPYTYDPASHPHAARTAFGYSMSYDANGNLVARTKAGETWSTSWTGFDKPRWLAKNGMGSEFHYNANRLRVMHLEFDQMSGNQPSRYTRKRLYALGSKMEVDYVNRSGWKLDRVRVYVPGPEGVVGTMEFAPYATFDKAERALVYHYDHLGSIAAVTPYGSTAATNASTDSGLEATYSYDAWGQRRNPITWSGAPSTTSKGGPTDVTPRGYTGHEMLDEIGLVHMNGRIYDPLLGRFLSADILVSNGNNLQSYNRYSYVRNNPLTLTDPSGFIESDEREEYRKKLEEKTRLIMGLTPRDRIINNIYGGGESAAASAVKSSNPPAATRVETQKPQTSSQSAVNPTSNETGNKAPNSGGIDPSGKGDIGTYLVRQNAAGEWVIVGKTNGVTTANAYVNGILGTLGRHAELGGKHMPAGVTEFTLFNNPSKGFFADVWETAMDKLGFTSAPAKALAGVLQGVQSSGSNVSWVAHSQGGAIFAEAMSYAGGSLSNNSVTFNAGANNHWVTNSIAASAGVQVNGYYYSSWDAVPNVIGANGNPLSMLGSVLAAPLLFTDNHSPHTAPTSGWRKRF